MTWVSDCKIHKIILIPTYPGEQVNEEKQAGSQGGELGVPAQPADCLEDLSKIFSTDESWGEGHAG